MLLNAFSWQKSHQHEFALNDVIFFEYFLVKPSLNFYTQTMQTSAQEIEKDISKNNKSSLIIGNVLVTFYVTHVFKEFIYAISLWRYTQYKLQA